MVVYEDVSETTVRAYSDAGKMIHGGFPEGDYAEAYDPAAAQRTYVETDKFVPTRQRPPVRTFSKLKIVSALMQAEVWPQVKAFIEQQGLYDLFVAAQDFAEGNTYFEQGKAALQSSLGWTDAQVEALLSACLADE